MKILSFILVLILSSNFTFANTRSNEEIKKIIVGVLENIIVDNQKFSEKTGVSNQEYIEKQSPRATILMCSDSRIQSSSFDDTPINDLFIVRNIGNQLLNNLGSVEYGIRHLNTPVLLIIGHVHCGAVKAAMSKHELESKAINTELKNIKFIDDTSILSGVIGNVHNQIDLAMNKFKEEINKGSLVVIGAVYDFANNLGHGNNKLVIINFNGERSQAEILKNEYLKNISNVSVGADYAIKMQKNR